MALTVAHEPGGARRLVESGDRAVLVGQQRHLGRAAGDVGHPTHQSVVRHDRGVLLDAGIGAGRDPDLLFELGGPGDDPRVHRRVVEREARAVDELELLPEFSVLLQRRLSQQLLLAQLVHLLLQARVLPLHVHEAREVAVDVPERAGDPLGGHLEWAEHGRPGALHAVDGAS